MRARPFDILALAEPPNANLHSERYAYSIRRSGEYIIMKWKILFHFVSIPILTKSEHPLRFVFDDRGMQLLWLCVQQCAISP